MAQRRSGFSGSPVNGTRSVQAISPNPSSGRPAPSSTRPSKPSPTSTSEALCVGTTRAPGINPRTLPVGIKKSLSPEKPTTSASTCLPSAVSTRQRPPTAASHPTASNVMPTIRLKLPSTTTSRISVMRSRALTNACNHSLGRGRLSFCGGIVNFPRDARRPRCAPCPAVHSRSRRVVSPSAHRSWKRWSSPGNRRVTSPDPR